MLMVRVGGMAQAGQPEVVRARGRLQVCIWADYFAISYRNPRTGMLEGIGIDMAAGFARRLGVTLEFIDPQFQ